MAEKGRMFIYAVFFFLVGGEGIFILFTRKVDWAKIYNRNEACKRGEINCNCYRSQHQSQHPLAMGKDQGKLQNLREHSVHLRFKQGKRGYARSLKD